MRERLDDTIQVPSFTEQLVNTDDAVGKRVRAEHANLLHAIEFANKRCADLIASYHATFSYRVSRILEDPEAVLPQPPNWGPEVAE